MAAIAKQRPIDKSMTVAATGRVSMEWDAFFNKLQSQSSSAAAATTVQNVTATSTTAINLGNGGVINLTLSASIATMTITGAASSGTWSSATFIITQGAAYTVAWPAGVKWVAATAPTITTGTGKVDIIVLTTITAGSTWYGFVTGQNMS
jgi:hypothetical protein